MRYVSTRGYGSAAPVSFTDILLDGLAPDGGLYVPESYPHLSASDLTRLTRTLATEGYPGLAAQVLSLFIDDIPGDDLAAICSRAYTPAKFGPETVPVSQVEPGLWLAHLSDGPTAAFKDLAMQLLAQLFDYVLDRADQSLTILGATSGDTGSAAEHAMLGTSRVKVFMLSPLDRMSPFQRGQMYGIDDPRIVNITVPGSFDDCQDLVKEVNADAEFKRRYAIGAVNSINWARLVAQVVYYISSWALVTGGRGDVSFTVPSGNFGNIAAGHIARTMGLPIQELVCATNENDVLAEFFETGIYRVRSAEETLATSSPSMDISKASNFERFFFDVTGRNSEEIRHLFGEQLPKTSVIDIRDRPYWPEVNQKWGFRAGRSTHADRLATIADVWRRDGYLLDPHTADGVTVARRHLAAASGGVPMIAMETALPVKFSATIHEAISQDPQIPERFAQVMKAPQHTLTCNGGAAQLKKIIASLS